MTPDEQAEIERRSALREASVDARKHPSQALAAVAERDRELQPGNSNLTGLVHGGNSERVIAERAKQVHAELLEVAPWLDKPAYAPAVDRYLKAASREALLHNYIEHVSITHKDGIGAIRPLTLEQATKAANLADKLARELGLTPKSHAQLRLLQAEAFSSEHHASDLADLAAEGQRLRYDADPQVVTQEMGPNDRP